MLHTAIRSADPAAAHSEPDPDVDQAIGDFRELGRNLREAAIRIARLSPGDPERERLERCVATDMALLDLRAARIGGGWTGLALLEAIMIDGARRARRVAHPRRESNRTHLDRVQLAIARRATAERRLAEARREYESATSAVLAAEHAARHFASREPK